MGSAEADGEGDVAQIPHLDALLAGLPDVFVNLQAEARGQAVGEHPFDDEAWVERAVFRGALVARGL